MDIGIDISMLVYQGSGVATYTHNLVKHLLKIDTKNSYHLFYSSFRRSQHIITILNEFRSNGAQIYDVRLPPRILALMWNTGHMIPVEWFTGKLDVYHSSDFLRPPLMKGTKGVTTIHDLTWKKYPQFHTQNVIDNHTRKLDKTVQYGDTIIVDSKQTRDDLQNYYPNATGDVHLVPLGVDERFFTNHSDDDINKKIDSYGIKKPYLLYVGAIEPRKNLVTLVRAFAMVLKKNLGLHLVLAGRSGWKNEDVYAEIDKLHISEKVQFTGYVEDEDLPYIYQGASVFVYPSLYEGFGLPPLEAMASGAPTIAYNSPSISDVFVDSIDPSDLAQQIQSHLDSKEVKKMKIPTWEETARQMLEIFTQD